MLVVYFGEPVKTGNDKKTVRRERIEPIKRVLLICVLLSNTLFITIAKWFKIACFNIKKNQKKSKQ